MWITIEEVVWWVVGGGGWSPNISLQLAGKLFKKNRERSVGKGAGEGRKELTTNFTANFDEMIEMRVEINRWLTEF